jgi:hypothetical protein
MKKQLLIVGIIISGNVSYKMFVALMDVIDKPEMTPFYKYLFSSLLALMTFSVCTIALIELIKKGRSH